MRHLTYGRAWPAIALVAGTVVLVASRTFGVPLGVILLIATIAVLVNGFVASLEDDLPGGFNRPDGWQESADASLLVKVARFGLGLLLLLFAAAFVLVYVVQGDRALIPLYVGCSLCCAISSFGLFARRAWARWPALFALLAGVLVTVLLR